MHASLKSKENNLDSCVCNNELPSPRCPLTFIHNGKLLHGITHADRQECGNVKIPEGGYYGNPGQTVQQPDPVPYDQFTEAYTAVEGLMNERTRRTYQNSSLGPVKTLENSEKLMINNQEMLSQYSPLNVGGRKLTDISIGGFAIDLAKTAEKASAVVPLPPAKLPRIFVDTELNFNHHFFQGLEKMLGRDKVLLVVSKSRHYESGASILLPLIERVLKCGYEKRDTQLIVFTKSVLASTFDIDERVDLNDDIRGLTVSANLWGFQYIEPGMEMGEADLQMWLSICYDRFRAIFFNSFKDSGIPAFAMEGVQTRYELPRTQEVTVRMRTREATQSELPVQFEQAVSDTMSTSGRSSKHHRKTRGHRNDMTIGSILMGGKR